MSAPRDILLRLRTLRIGYGPDSDIRYPLPAIAALDAVIDHCRALPRGAPEPAVLANDTTLADDILDVAVVAGRAVAESGAYWNSYWAVRQHLAR